MLEATLMHLSEAVDLGGEFELLVIDNGSCPETKAVTENANLPVNYYSEPRTGISFARNKALEKSQGEYLLFLDDDCLPVKDWLREAYQVISYLEKEQWGMVGGKVINHFLHKRPPWLTGEVISYYSQIDLGDEVMELNRKNGWIPEGNCLINKSAITQVGSFNISLGHKKKSLLSHEGNDLMTRMIAAGFRCYYWPALEVSHQIHEKERYSRCWLYRRAFLGGKSEGMIVARDDTLTAPDFSHWKALFHPRTLYRAFFSKQSIEKSCQFFHKLGYLRGFSDARKVEQSTQDG